MEVEDETIDGSLFRERGFTCTFHWGPFLGQVHPKTLLVGIVPFFLATEKAPRPRSFQGGERENENDVVKRHSLPLRRRQPRVEVYPTGWWCTRTSAREERNEWPHAPGPVEK